MARLFIFSLLLLCISCINSKAQNKIDAAQLEDLLKTEGIQLVDLRTPDELAKTGKLETAKHINYNSPDFKTQIGQLDKEKPVIIYCAAGGRSGKAMGVMTEMGFKTICDYSGGMNDWLAKGKKTVKE